MEFYKHFANVTLVLGVAIASAPGNYFLDLFYSHFYQIDWLYFAIMLLVALIGLLIIYLGLKIIYLESRI
jgi:hypothetical protein